MTNVIERRKVNDQRFQYRKRYEVTCDPDGVFERIRNAAGFNTASGMRSHVTSDTVYEKFYSLLFQYRKRYEVTCDVIFNLLRSSILIVSIPQAV